MYEPLHAGAPDVASAGLGPIVLKRFCRHMCDPVNHLVSNPALMDKTQEFLDGHIETSCCF